MDNLNAAEFEISPNEPETGEVIQSTEVEADDAILDEIVAEEEVEKEKAKSLGFRSWDAQQNALDKFHNDVEAKKAEEARLKKEQLEKEEAELYLRTQTSMAMFEADKAAQEQAEQQRREEELKRKEEEVHAKHYQLRKEREEAERKKKEAEEEKERKAEAKRKRQLEAQAKKMKKFEEDRRWKTLPGWKKEREEEYLDMVKQLQKFDPSRDKYEFFDVHRVPEAWDAELLESELKKAESAKGEKLLAQLKTLLPPDAVDESQYKKDDRWDFAALEAAISKAEAEVAEEETRGKELFDALLIYCPTAQPQSYHQPDTRPRWDFGKIETHTANAKKEIGELVEALKQFFPDLTIEGRENPYAEEKFLDEEKRWNVSACRDALNRCKQQWEQENKEGEAKFALLRDVDPEADRAAFFCGDHARSPWRLQEIEAARDGRIRVHLTIVELPGEDGETKPTTEQSLVLREGDTAQTLLGAVELDSDKLSRAELFSASEREELDVKLQDNAQLEHKASYKLSIAAPPPPPKPETPVKDPTPEPPAKQEAQPKSAGKKSSPPVSSSAKSQSAGNAAAAEENVPPPSGGCCTVL